MVMWIILSMFFSDQTQAISISHMEKLCGQILTTPEDHGEIAFVFDPTNSSHRDCTLILRERLMDSGHSPEGFLLAFQEVNLVNSDCNEVNISIEQYQFNPNYVDDYEYVGSLYPDEHDIPDKLRLDDSHEMPSLVSQKNGIPLPLCKDNIPWTSFPSPILLSEDYYLKIRFQARTSVSRNTGFKLFFSVFYTSSYRCQPGEYRCNNDRCIPWSARNENCDGIDWCGDNSGCDNSVDAVLVGSISAGIACAILGFVIGLCLARHLKAKQKRSIEARLDAATEMVRRNFDIFPQRRSAYTTNNARPLSTLVPRSAAPNSAYELNSNNERGRERVSPSSFDEYNNRPYNSNAHEMNDSTTSPPPAYETVMADVKEEPETSPPSYREVAENPAGYHPYGVEV